MKISDSIASYIMELLEEQNMAEIRRNELASLLGCAPSQINYVLTSRFTPEQGYRIESRRGGGGFIRITRVYRDGDTILSELIGAIGQRIDGTGVRAILSHLLQSGLADERTVCVMTAALSDQSLSGLSVESRERVRAAMMKNMLMAIRD